LDKRGVDGILATAGALVLLQLVQGGMALQSSVDAVVDSVFFGMAVASVVSTSGTPIELGWTWVSDAVLATWKAGVPSLSSGMEKVFFWCLVAGGLAVQGSREPSNKNCQRFPSLLEDFWPGTMIEKKGQPIKVKEFSVNGRR